MDTKGCEAFLPLVCIGKLKSATISFTESDQMAKQIHKEPTTAALKWYKLRKAYFLTLHVSREEYYQNINSLLTRYCISNVTKWIQDLIKMHVYIHISTSLNRENKLTIN